VFCVNEKYTSVISVDGDDTIIAKVGNNKAYYDAAGRLAQIGMNRVSYNEQLGHIETIAGQPVIYDDKKRLVFIGRIPIRYDKRTGCISHIGDDEVSYTVTSPTFATMNGQFYSPVKSKSAMTETEVCLPIAFDLESANRVRMEEYITSLSNESECSSALFKIQSVLKQEREQRNTNRYNEGYCAAAIQYRAIDRIAPCLQHAHLKMKSNARGALIELFNTITQKQKSEFNSQIKQWASVIVDSVLASIGATFKSERECGAEMLKALELLFILPLADPDIQTIIIEKKIIAALVEKGKNTPAVSSIINEKLSHMKALCFIYKKTIAHLTVTIEDLKEYYVTHSVWTKQGNMFKPEDGKLETVLQSLEARATNKPGGTADGTLSHFGFR
jgi:hypothetical protein